uniref:RING-type domain-containing protein n=1 Tax=Maylandia zebra TaxID=106582 RepID=A0A3P9DR82_9CICH
MQKSPEFHLLCPVCLSVFTKPVSIPCGHNFCMNCITDYWSTLSVLQCPFFTKSHTLNVAHSEMCCLIHTHTLKVTLK